jgi:hypothetical protein
MAKQTINIGTSANSKDGDIIRDAFNKTNQNFDEIYTALTDGVNFAQVNADWTAQSGVAQILNKPTIPTNTNQLTNGAGFITSTASLVNGEWTVSLGADGVLSAGSITFGGTLKTGSQSQYQFEELVTGEGEDTVYYSKLTLPNIPEIFGGETLSLVTWGSELAIKVRNPSDFFNDYTWLFGNDGNLTVPDRITFSDNTWQSTAFVGTAYELRNSPTGNLYVTLDDRGTINTPLLLPKTFTAVVDPAHYFGEGTLVLEGEAWSFGVQFQVGQDGTVQTIIDNPVRGNNPGYVNGLTFTFVEADHGISGYTFSISLSDIQHPTELVWTVNIAVSPPPEYPATVASLGAIKLLAGEATWVFDTGGSIILPTGGFIGPVGMGWPGFSSAPGGIVSVQATTENTEVSSQLLLASGTAMLQTTQNASILANGVTVTRATYFDAEAVWELVRDEDASIIAPEVRPWAGMPSYQAYPLLVSYTPPEGVLPPSSNMAPTANNAQQAYQAWQEELAGTNTIISVVDKTWTFGSDGSITYPGDVKQSYQDNTSCLPNVDTVVYTSTGINQKAIKLFVMVEGLTDGGGLSWDTQACDIIAVKGYNNNIVHVTTYGVTYSGAAAIATFDGQWNTLTNRIEITCRPISVTNDVRVSVHAIEMTTND